MQQARADDARRKLILLDAQKLAAQLKVPVSALDRCVQIAKLLGTEGHRAELVMTFATRAYAALQIAKGERTERKVLPRDVDAIAELAAQHRREDARRGHFSDMTSEDKKRIADLPISA